MRESNDLLSNLSITTIWKNVFLFKRFALHKSSWCTQWCRWLCATLTGKTSARQLVLLQITSTDWSPVRCTDGTDFKMKETTTNRQHFQSAMSVRVQGWLLLIFPYLSVFPLNISYFLFYHIRSRVIDILCLPKLQFVICLWNKSPIAVFSKFCLGAEMNLPRRYLTRRVRGRRGWRPRGLSQTIL